MIDAVKIYGKTKEQFGWPDEPPEEFPAASVSNICPSNRTGDSDSAAPAVTGGTVLERYRAGGAALCSRRLRSPGGT